MNNKILIHLIAAARPNFMKIAPLYHELKKEDCADPVIVHNGPLNDGTILNPDRLYGYLVHISVNTVTCDESPSPCSPP